MACGGANNPFDEFMSGKNICKDGGLLKKILKPGEDGELLLEDHDHVLVKYEARLDDGTLVKKSDRAEFTLNDGHFCPALSIAVKTMKVGEKVSLTVKPQYGFGDKGKPAHCDEGSVPPNATLHITLQFVSLKKAPFHKKVLKEGEGDDCPNEGALVKLKLIGKLQDSTVFFKKGYSDVDGDEAELFEFKTDEDQVIDGLDRAVMSMKKGEIALLTIPPQYAFGSSESHQERAVVPPNSTLYYEVELVSFVKEAWDMNTKEKIEAALKKREEGQVLFRANECARASKCFQKAVKFVDDDTSFSYEEREIVRGLKFTCNLLSATCMMEMKDYEQQKKFNKLLNLKRIDPKRWAVERSYLRKGIICMDYTEGLSAWFTQSDHLHGSSASEKIEAALKKKEEGLALFRANECARASKKFQKAVKFVEDDTSFSDEERKIVAGLKLSCNMLIETCMMKLKDYEQQKKINKDICKDGGFLKKILKPGEDGELLLEDHDHVLVKYEARLDDGTLIKKSDYDGVEFTLKDGHFCSALSIAVKTMNVGEKVSLTVKPQYGFGDKGKPAHHDEGSVPPNATLHITLEFVSWKKAHFHKKVLKEGEGNDCPNEGALVKLKLIGKLQDSTVFFKKGYSDVDGDEAELFEFKTDEDQVIDGLDRAVMSMKKGEVALLTIPPQYAFGSSESQLERAVVTPNSTLYYEVELVSFVKAKEAWDMNTKEKIEAALKKKEEGLALFRANECARASKKFQKAVKFVEDDTSFSDEERKIVVGLKFSCDMLSATCMMKLKDYEQQKRINKLLKLKRTDPKRWAVERKGISWIEGLQLIASSSSQRCHMC